MRDIDNTFDQLAIVPQEQSVILNFSFYYSKIPSIKNDGLEDDKYKSNRLNILSVCCFSLSSRHMSLRRNGFTQTSKAANAPEGFPDYTTFIVRTRLFACLYRLTYIVVDFRRRWATQRASSWAT